MINETSQSKIDWIEFRKFEKEKHEQFFLKEYPKLGMRVISDIFDDTKTNDYDVIVEYDGRKLKIDEKARKAEYDDLLVEVMQCIRYGRIGWLYKQIDAIFYASWGDLKALDPTSAYLIRMQDLRDYVVENWEQLEEHFSKKGYGLTLNKRVAWRDLIYLKIAKKII